MVPSTSSLKRLPDFAGEKNRLPEIWINPQNSQFLFNRKFCVKEPTHYSKRVGDVVPGVVVYLHLHHHSSQVGRVQWVHKWTDSGCHRRP